MDNSDRPENLDPDFLELEALSEEDLSAWEKVCTADTVTVYKKKLDDSPIVMVMAFALIKGISSDTVYTVMSEQNIRKQWDKVLSNFSIIDEDEDSSVVYYIIKTPIGLDNRDFLQRRKVLKDFP